MMRAWLLALASLLVLAGPARAEICYGPTTSYSDAQPTTAATVFQCPQAASGTLTQLAAQGWRVVRLTTIQTAGGASPLIAAQLLLRPNDRLFRSGFE